MAVKVKNELKIGIMVVVAIVLLVLGLNYLKGKNIFSSENEYYTYYDNVQGLQESAIVQLNGLGIGKVSEVTLQPDKRIKVMFTVDKDVKIPAGSIAKLAANDLISGTKVISLRLSDSSRYLKDDDFIQGEGSEGLLDNLSETVSPLVGSVQNTIITLDTLLSSVNSIVNGQTRQHLNQSFASLDTALRQFATLAKVLNQQSQNLAGVIENANNITGNLASNNEKINTTFTNLEAFSNSLSAADIQKTLQDLQAAADQLKSFMTKVNDNNGTLGMLVTDKQLYHNLTSTLSSLDILLDDVKKHPAKYINISVFGRKTTAE